MVELILIVIGLIYTIKPELAYQKYVDKATEEQKGKLFNSVRTSWGTLTAMFVGLAICDFVGEPLIWLVIIVASIVALFAKTIPAIKETSQITKELKNQ